MKKNNFYAFLFILLSSLSWAQTSTETFETETTGSTSFTDNGQVFNITSQARGPFDIQGSFPGTGWSGTAADNKYIDNDGFAGTGFAVGFTISSAGAVPFKLNSMYMFFSNAASLNQSVGGSLTLVGKLAGVTKFTATASSGFVTSTGTNNGFTFINMSTFGGSNNSNTVIDQIVITTGGQYEYVALDAFTWTKLAALSATTSFTAVSCNGGTNGRASVSVTGGTSPYNYSWAPSGGTASLATGLGAGIYTVTVTDAGSTSTTATVSVNQPLAISTTTAVTNVACNGNNTGAASVSVSGGTPSYFYSWAPSGGTGATATGLTAGVYTVTVTDNNSCTKTALANVTQPTPLITSTAVTNVACNGGSNGVASITASGGAGSYSFLWSNGASTSAITGRMAGVYTATVTDANSCTSIKSSIITQPSALVTSTAVTNVACNGGSNGVASITASGGTVSYSYLWSNGGSTSAITGLMAGVYTATVTDANSCTSIKSANVTQFSALVTSTAVTNVSCNGGSNGVASITASGGAGSYTYLWSNGGSTSAITGLMAGVYTATVTDANSCTSIKSANVTQFSALTTATAVTNVACNGGSNGVASITASGGAGGYSYLWSNGGSTSAITGLMAGVYTATVTDANSCASIKSANVTQLTPLVTTTAVTNVACNGGSNGVASISASGGAGGYSYLWSNGGSTSAITSLMAGVYTATVTDANSCTSIKSANVTQFSALSTSTAVTNVACNGGSNGVASITVSGGAGGYSYLWSNGGSTSAITGLMAGVYTATVTDANSCTSIKSANVTQFSALTTATAVTNVACNGGSNGVASITASGGAGGYSYLWSNGGTTSAITGLMAGVYTATVTDANSCTSIKSANVTQFSALVTTTAVTTVACNGGSNGVASITASDGAGSYTYLWSNGGSTSSITGLMAGVYTATVTDANSCTSIKSANVTQLTAISTSTSATNISCNGGSNGIATVSASGGAGGYTYLWSNGGTTSSISGLIAGVYTATVTDANSCIKTAIATVTQPSSALSATSSFTNVSCFGGNNGKASVAVTGGTSPYTYSWTPSGGTAATASGLTQGTYTCTITDNNICTLTKIVSVTQPATAISATSSGTNINCFGGNTGMASVSATGGTSPYTYAWAPSGGTASTASGLTANTYSCNITDNNGCTLTKTVAVTQPASGIIATASATNINCFGGNTGMASVSATGGTSPYIYAWAPTGGTAATASGLTQGTYTCTITDNASCSITKTVSVSQPAAALSAITGFTNVSCFGGANGKTSVAITGGTSPYTYSWTPTGGTAATATGLSQGIYTCTITDNASCTLTKTVSVTQPATAISAISSSTNVSCFGGTTGAASVSATGGTSPYTYAWTPSGGTTATATGLTANNYTCTITDNNSCTLTKTVSITQPASAISATASSTNTSCFGGSNGIANVIVTGGTSPYTYSWAASGGTAATASGLTQGTYTCTITDNASCTLTKTVSIGQPTAITSAISSTNTACVGNSGVATVSGTSGGTGAYTYSWSPTGGTASTATSLGVGIYTCTIKDANSCSLTLTTTVNTINGPSLSITSQTNVSCSGGSNGGAQVSTTGGISPYTYSWTPGTSTSTVATGLTAGTYSCVVTDNNGCTAIQGITISQPAPVVVTATVSSAILCNGGVATVSISATGGTPAYSGIGTFTATAGLHTYTVTDNNACTSSATISVTEPAVLVATASATGIYCHGGMTTITVTATGGTSPYTGTGTFTATAGTYNYTVTDSHACSTSTMIALTDPAVIMTTQSFSLCTGQSVTVGTSTYSAAGTYTNMITTAHGCDSTITTNIIVNSLPTVTVTPVTATVCAGSPVSLTAGGANTYTWSNGNTNGTQTVSPTIGITYTVTGKDANLCQNTATVHITVNSAPSVSATTSSTLVCKGQSVTLTGQGATTYTWTNGVTNGTAFTPSITATYTVTGQAANSCKGTATVAVTVSPCTGIEALTSNEVTEVFPNPGTGYYTIRFSDNNGKDIRIYDVTGRIVYENLNTHDNPLQVNIANEPKGMYFVKIQSGTVLSVKKIINQ